MCVCLFVERINWISIVLNEEISFEIGVFHDTSYVTSRELTFWLKIKILYFPLASDPLKFMKLPASLNRKAELLVGVF